MRLPFHLLALRDTTPPWRQAFCAAFGVGLPVLAAIWLHSSWGILFGAVGGVYASLLDFGGTLKHRLYTQGAGLCILAVCGLLGTWLGPHHVMMWAVLAMLTFGIGWVDGTASALENILRFSTLFLLINAFLPELPSSAYPYFGLGMAAGLLAVWLDSLYWPRHVPSQAKGLGPALRQIMGGHTAGLSHAMGFCLTTCSALALAIALGYERPAWVATVTLFVIRPDGPDSLRRLFQSVFGASVGVAVAWSIAHQISDARVLLACVVLLAFMRPIALAFNLWGQAATITSLVLVLFDAAMGSEGRAASLALLRIRFLDVLLGSAVALVGTLIFNAASRRHLFSRMVARRRGENPA